MGQLNGGRLFTLSNCRRRGEKRTTTALMRSEASALQRSAVWALKRYQQSFT